ncbi:MAG: polysaccharide biosynthesis/export family protein [Muribaculaceae bacterium]|nr:polysaccharide biosynthesis/export family protein [Muribaculaceae bacterium]
MKIRPFLCAALLAAMAVSCTSSKNNNLAYFKDIATNASGVLPNGPELDIRLVADNELAISISSAQPEATAMYNVPLGNPATRGVVSTQGQPRLLTYIIDKQGNIELPVIGTMHVAGKTTAEVASEIKQFVAQNVRDPYVRVELLGFHVNVMGEVKSPHRIYVQSQRYSVLDALAEAGDLTEFAKRDAVTVIREQNGQKTYQRLNLADSQIFASPYFYLQQNDVVYVEPNTIKIDNSKYNQNNAFKLSVISTVVSAASVIASLVIALTVK